MAVPAGSRGDVDIDWFSAVDVTEARQEYVFKVDLPVLKPEEIQVSVDSDGLSIGEQPVPKRQSGKTVQVEPLLATCDCHRMHTARSTPYFAMEFSSNPRLRHRIAFQPTR